MKAATGYVPIETGRSVISIHAAREGGDIAKAFNLPIQKISIPAAREGGDGKIHFPPRKTKEFQSTPPVKAATSQIGQLLCFVGFQSTPPVKAATYRQQGLKLPDSIFQSTPPVKAATIHNVVF